MEEGVVDGVAHQSRAPAELSGPPITVVVVGQRPVSQHHRDVGVRPLPGKQQVKHDTCRTRTLDVLLNLRSRRGVCQRWGKCPQTRPVP